MDEDEERKKDGIGCTLIELSCALAEKEMADKYNLLPEEFSDGDNYKEEYQEEFNFLYDKYYNLLAGLCGFSM